MSDRPAATVPLGYRLVTDAPPVPDYLRLRSESGLTPRTQEQAQAGAGGAWAACHVVHEASGEVVAMGRALGDGGWYFHIVDMAVLPAHQRRGLGGAVLDSLLARIREDAPPDAYVSLMADPPGQPLYAARGFTETAPRSVGMALWT